MWSPTCLLANAFDTANALVLEYTRMKTHLIAIALACCAGYVAPVLAQEETEDLPPEVRITVRTAKEGQAESQYNLGVMYSQGKFMEQNDRKAVYWWRKAAVQGHAMAQNNLAIMYMQGKGGLDRSDEEAAKLFRQSAEQGYKEAQHNLAVMLVKGQGVEKNQQEAVEWFRKAAAQGHPGAKDALKQLGKE